MRRLNAESRFSRNTRMSGAMSSDLADASRISRLSRRSFCSVEKSIYRFTVLLALAGSRRGESISQRDVGKRDVDVATRERQRKRECAPGPRAGSDARDSEIFAADYPATRESNRRVRWRGIFRDRRAANGSLKRARTKGEDEERKEDARASF
jgi:hypothetical protein